MRKEIFLGGCLLMLLTACQKVEGPAQVTQAFFTAFEEADYETMKTYCTKDCVETYFHAGDVDGMVWARLVELGEEELWDDTLVGLPVTVEMETTMTSVLYPETETSFYVELLREEGGWKIQAFPTGR